MSTFKGNVVMGTVAATPVALFTTWYLLDWIPFQGCGLVTRTLLGLLYAFILYAGPYGYFTSPLRDLPAPEGDRFFLGHVPQFFERPPGSAAFRWMKETPNDGLICARTLFHRFDNLVLTTPETIMQVLNAHSYDWEKPAAARKFLTRVLGRGLVNVEGNEHKIQRKNVTPAFSGKTVKDLVPLFWDKAFAFADAVEREAAEKERTIEVSHLAHLVTLDIIGSAGIGKDFHTIDGSEHELATYYAAITNPKKGPLIPYFLINIILPIRLIRKLPFGPNARLANVRVANGVHELRRVTKDLLQEKKRAVQEKSVQKDIIAVLMQSGKFTDEGLTDQLLTFLAAGHETTASALTWASYLLARHTDIQSRLRAECQSHLGGATRTSSITAETIDSLPLLDAVCNETLRIYPTVPITSRHAIRETRINDRIIPKGTGVLICPWALNRLPSLWGPDAEDFRPDRWLEGPNAKYGGTSSPYAFITFLHGPRSCIGQSFARWELKCLLAVLVMRFALRLKKEGEVPVPDGTITIRPRDGLELVVTPVKAS